MAIAKSNLQVLPEVAVPAGGTKASPAAGGASLATSTTTLGRSGLNYRIKNGASAPGAAGVMTIQAYDGVKWFDYYTVPGDTVAGSEYSGSFPLEAYVQGVRCICYGHTTNPVTFELTISAVAG